MATGGQDDRTTRRIEKDGSRATQSALLGMALVGVTLATFGPLFYLAIAYGLLVAAGVFALLSLRWSDRALHAAPRMTKGVRRDAELSRLLSLATIAFVVYYTGFWILLVVLWPLVLFLGLLGWSAHRSRVASAHQSVEVGA